jgi:2,5-diamino-6-(ribosylamino)-4(3H)-pyrimidinone 5'-phosphate reductase
LAACIVSHGGGGINGALLREGFVDEIQMIWFPTVIGGAGTPSSFDGDPLRSGEAPHVMTDRIESERSDRGFIETRQSLAASSGEKLQFSHHG